MLRWVLCVNLLWGQVNRLTTRLLHLLWQLYIVLSPSSCDWQLCNSVWQHQVGRDFALAGLIKAGHHLMSCLTWAGTGKWWRRVRDGDGGGYGNVDGAGCPKMSLDVSRKTFHLTVHSFFICCTKGAGAKAPTAPFTPLWAVQHVLHITWKMPQIVAACGVRRCLAAGPFLKTNA